MLVSFTWFCIGANGKLYTIIASRVILKSIDLASSLIQQLRSLMSFPRFYCLKTINYSEFGEIVLNILYLYCSCINIQILLYIWRLVDTTTSTMTTNPVKQWAPCYNHKLKMRLQGRIDLIILDNMNLILYQLLNLFLVLVYWEKSVYQK